MEKGKEKSSGRRGRRGTNRDNSARRSRIISSGGVVYKKEGSVILWLVTASMPSPEYPKTVWRLPKGWLDDEAHGKKPGPLARAEKRATEAELQSNALKEIREEGGVEAKIIQKLGTERYYYRTKEEGLVMKFVTFYIAEWKFDLPESFGPETSKVLWLPLDEARKKITNSGEKKILDKAFDIIDTSGGVA